MQFLDFPSATFSGRGTQMMSRNGQATISNYLCFKHGYTNEELRLTGLKQVVDQEKLDQIQERDHYGNVRNKVNSNSGAVNKEIGQVTVSDYSSIEEELKKQREKQRRDTLWPGQPYQYQTNPLFERGLQGNDLQEAKKQLEYEKNLTPE